MTTPLIDAKDLFLKFGGGYRGAGYPVFDADVHETDAGTLYLKQPGVCLFAMPQFCTQSLGTFLRGFGADLGFMQYLEDPPIGDVSASAAGFEPELLPQPGANIAKTAGQLCYLSFGANRTKNADAAKYHDNIKSSRHGSVLEHPSYTFLVYGVPRDFTHEAVRHRVGVAFSQVSQRYVDGKTLRFVERPEYQRDSFLHGKFEERIDRAAKEYAEIADHLVRLQISGDQMLSSEKRTELRKKVNQAARSGLPNETEAPIMISGNARALRHIIEMRADGPADLPIRAVGVRILTIMKLVEPTLFDDYSIVELPDGTYGAQTSYRKV
jgi:thymidylate synthase (FAD)